MRPQKLLLHRQDNHLRIGDCQVSNALRLPKREMFVCNNERDRETY